MKVCHMSSVHTNRDVRIFLKECTSLAKAGYEVYYVAFGETRQENDVCVVGLGPAPNSRKERLLKSRNLVYETAMKLDCDIYHFHDPELLPYGLKLKKAGKKVIFDSHEDVSAQILDKYWIPKPVRKIVSTSYYKYETNVVNKLDAVVAATPAIARNFEKRTKTVITVNNYPKLDDIEYQDIPFTERKSIIGYAGGLDTIRGRSVLFKAMEMVHGELLLGGVTPEKQDNDNSRLVFLGQLSRKEVNDLYAKCRAGIVLYQPAANHVSAQPIKMFEYMAAGIPFVASDFPLWKQLVEGNNCGICVDPASPNAVANALNWLIDNPVEGQRMGCNGRNAVVELYNWKNEEKKLLSLYKGLF